MLLDFHFLRPYWLLALVPTVALWIYLVRRNDAIRTWRDIVAGHLVPYVIRDRKTENRVRPPLLLGFVIVVTCFALAGPTWLREPAPFADDEAALIIALEVTPTMLAQDVQPSRLTRATQKIQDLLAHRKGAATALIAYAGSSHLVLPLTEDSDLLSSFAAELRPNVMPAEGDAADKAVDLAYRQLSSSGRSGSVLLITDGVTRAAERRIEEMKRKHNLQVHVYGVAAGSEAIVPADSPPAAPLDRDSLERAASAGNGSAVFVTADSRDVARIARLVETEFTSVQSPEGTDRWKDLGYWLVPFVALLMIPWCRSGWSVRYD